MTYNLLKNSIIRNSVQCRHDSNEGYSVFWDVEDDFKGFTSYSGTVARLVSNGSYFMATTGSGCSVTTPSDALDLDASVYSKVTINMRIDPGFGHTSPTTGKLGFMLSDDVDWQSENEVSFTLAANNAYTDYTLDMSIKEEWVGTIVRIRLFPILDGVPGQHVFVRSIRITSPIVFSCASRFSGAVCDRFVDYVHVCPFTGVGGSCSSALLPDTVTISGGVNDKLLVDINSYGNQTITLDEGINIALRSLAKDVESKLNAVGIGGYAFASCDVVAGRLLVSADTREAASTVSVLPTVSGSAAFTLGFSSSAGEDISQKTLGSNPASRYESEASAMVSRSDLDRFYATDQSVAGVFSVDPSEYSVQGGYIGYEVVDRSTTLDFENKTFVDFNNPITENGLITTAHFSGTAHKNSEFRVYRQSLNGDISFVAGITFGSATDDNTGKLFQVDCGIRVRKGDLVGLYSASLHTGKDTVNPSFSYVLYDGDLQFSVALEIVGDGERGAPIFCRGGFKKSKAALVVEFEHAEAVESFTVRGTETANEEIINLTKTSDVRVTGYTGVDINGDKAPEWTGLSAITDGSKLDTNSTSLSAYPLWWGSTTQSDFDYTEAGLYIDITPGVDVLFNIHRVAIYFEADANIKHFTLDYPQNTNPQDSIRNWQPVAASFSSVSIDGLLSPTTRYFYSNPAIVTAASYHQDYVSLVYRSIDFRFPAVLSRSIRYRGYLDRTTAVLDYTANTLADFPIYLNPKIQEVEVYAKSSPEASVQDNVSLFSSSNGVDYIEHFTSYMDSLTDIRFVVGYPVRFVKLFIEPSSVMTVNKVSMLSSFVDQSVSSSTSSEQSEHHLVGSINKPDESVSTIVVSNSSSEVSTYSVNITEDAQDSDAVSLWNKMDSEESLRNSEVGPGGIVYKRDNFTIKSYNAAFNRPAYLLDLNFASSSPCYISYDMMSTWEASGSIFVDGSKETGVSNESAGFLLYPRVYATIDLTEQYDIDTVTLVKASSIAVDAGWDPTIYYSSEDVSSPAAVTSWTLSSIHARWVRISVNSVAPGTGTEAGLKTLGFARISVSLFSNFNYGSAPWITASHLTNGSSGGVAVPADGVYSGMSAYYCVDLEVNADIAAVVLGPGACDTQVDASDFIANCNTLDSSFSSSVVAFSGTRTNNPKKVRWSPIGASKSGSDRWVLIKTDLCDEIAVFLLGPSAQYPLYDSTRWWSSVVGALSVSDEYCEPFHSISLQYPASTTTSEILQLTAPLGVDNYLGARDALSVCFYIDDVTQIDPSFGHFQLQKATSESVTVSSYSKTLDTDSFYVWDFDSIHSTLVNGWNFLTLPFSLNHHIGDTRFLENLSSSTLIEKKRSRIMGFSFSFRGLASGSSFNVKVDNLKILRSFFPPAKFSTGLYLSGSDQVRFPLGRFNHTAGALEFFIEPDWSKDLNCNTCSNLTAHTIFKFTNPYGYYMLMVMTTSGLKVFFSDGTSVLTHLDNSLLSLIAGSRSHLAFVWDLSDTSHSIFEIYINGTLSSYYPRESFQGTFNLDTMSDTQLTLGGRAWSGYVFKDISGLDGVVDNIKLYTYPKRDFALSMSSEGFVKRHRARDFLEISTDGVSFYGYDDVEVPFVVYNVAAGSSFTVYTRSKNLDQLSSLDHGRTAFLDITRTRTG